MGNLAERYKDPGRSGVYRVSSPFVPVQAAKEAHADLHEIDADDLDAALGRVGQRGAKPAWGRPRIYVVHGGQDRQLDVAWRLQQELRAQAQSVDPCFVVLIDPLRLLELPTLWREPPDAGGCKAAKRTPGAQGR